jgi:hypothetical protein
MKGGPSMPRGQDAQRISTRVVSEDIFKQVYDSPHALPGKHKWVTSDDDVRTIEELLGMKSHTIRAPLWVSGETKNCKTCGRETNWLDIVASGLTRAHSKEMIAKVILGDKKYINVEAPRAISDLQCYSCKAPIIDLRSFKCHNWAYAMPAIREVMEEMSSREG